MHFFLSQMVAEVGNALSQTKSVKMVSSGNSEVGAHKLTQEVMDISSSVPKLVESMTGVDIAKVSKVYNTIQYLAHGMTPYSVPQSHVNIVLYLR